LHHLEVPFRSGLLQLIRDRVDHLQCPGLKLDTLVPDPDVSYHDLSEAEMDVKHRSLIVAIKDATSLFAEHARAVLESTPNLVLESEEAEEDD
jgi:hypothetical protein